MTKDLDLATVKSKPKTIEILSPGPAGEPIGVRVTLVSLDDEKLINLKRTIRNENILRQTKRNKPLTAIEAEENETRLLVATVVGWEWYGDVNFRGEKPELNEKNIREVFNEIPWFKNQIAEVQDNSADFFTI